MRQFTNHIIACRRLKIFKQPLAKVTSDITPPKKTILYIKTMKEPAFASDIATIYSYDIFSIVFSTAFVMGINRKFSVKRRRKVCGSGK